MEPGASLKGLSSKCNLLWITQFVALMAQIKPCSKMPFFFCYFTGGKLKYLKRECLMSKMFSTAESKKNESIHSSIFH